MCVDWGGALSTECGAETQRQSHASAALDRRRWPQNTPAPGSVQAWATTGI